MPKSKNSGRLFIGKFFLSQTYLAPNCVPLCLCNGFVALLDRVGASHRFFTWDSACSNIISSAAAVLEYMSDNGMKLRSKNKVTTPFYLKNVPFCVGRSRVVILRVCASSVSYNTLAAVDRCDCWLCQN